MRIFINLSNHNSANWNVKQTEEALKYGNIIDLDFPNVDPLADETEIKNLAQKYYDIILSKEIEPTKITVHIMGEMTFAFQLIKKLQAAGVSCIASTSVRTVVELENGVKNVIFKFERFRRYE